MLIRYPDDNRMQLLAEQYPESVVQLLKSYISHCSNSSAPSPSHPMQLLDLQVVRTALGVLINASYTSS